MICPDGGARFVLVNASRSGIETRTAATLRDLLTDLMTNSGEEIAYWAEGAAREAAGKWRQSERDDAARTITPENYPTIFRAFQEIDLANGAINRLEPALTSYTVPGDWVLRLSNCESALAELSEADLATFCDGDADEAQALLDGKPAVLHSAHQLLNAYFSGWEE